MPDQQTFREAWGKYASSVSVITCIEPDGGVHGMAASDISSVSLDPMLVLVCVGHNRNSFPLIQKTGRFALNIMGEGQSDVVMHYAAPPEKRGSDEGISFTFTESGAAFIDGSVAQMDCRVVDEHVAGDHTIFIGEVDDIRVHEGMPLLYCEGSFGKFNEDSSGD